MLYSSTVNRNSRETETHPTQKSVRTDLYLKVRVAFLDPLSKPVGFLPVLELKRAQEGFSCTNLRIAEVSD